MPRLDFRASGSLELARKLVQEYEVGGFIVFGGDTESVGSATEELQGLSRLPLLFGCDAERGLGQIVSGGSIFPFTMALGAADDEGLAYSEALFTAGEMRRYGFNLVFAPVLDVNSNSENPIINIRSFGDDPELVSRLGGAFIRGCRDGGIFSCGKHFPGHGSAATDSHSELPVLSLTREELSGRDLIPFQRAISEGADMLMTAHVALPEITGNNDPATISREVVNGMLRGELGYGGVVITDSFRMSGISKLGDEVRLSLRALQAGCNIILDPQDPYKLLQILNDEASAGELDAEIIRKAASRVISLKKSLPILTPENARQTKEDGRKLSGLIARKSVSLLKGGSLKSSRALLCTFDVTESGMNVADAFARRLSDAGVTLKAVNVTASTNLDGLCREADDTALVCLVFTTVGAWKNQFSLPGFMRAALDRLSRADGESILVSFGSPYVVRGLDNFKTIICAFDSLGECQSAAADVLTGTVQATGRIPVAAL
jgi:beta-N-acetylhexosaminidase